MQVAVLVLYGKVPTGGFVIGDSDAQAMGFVVDLIDEIIEHGGWENDRHGETRLVGDDPHVGVDEAAKLEYRYLVKRTFGHSAQSAKGNGILLSERSQSFKPLFSFRPNGVNCSRVNQGEKIMKISELNYRTLKLCAECQSNLLHLSPHPQMSTCP